LEQVIELEPCNSTAWYQLGIIYIKKGMKTEGEEAFKKAEELQGEEE
jgi:cytochrome c-type biogenesis protein CcmH/NrfG